MHANPVSFLPGLANMKITALESMRTLSYFRLDTLHTGLLVGRPGHGVGERLGGVGWGGGGGGAT